MNKICIQIDIFTAIHYHIDTHGYVKYIQVTMHTHTHINVFIRISKFSLHVLSIAIYKPQKLSGSEQQNFIHISVGQRSWTRFFCEFCLGSLHSTVIQ